MMVYHDDIVGRYSCQLASSLSDSIKWDCMYDSIYLLLSNQLRALIEKDYPNVIFEIPKFEGAITYVEDTSRNQIIYSMELEFVEPRGLKGYI